MTEPAGPTSDKTELIRLANIVADDLEYRGYRAVGVIRQIIRGFSAAPAGPSVDECPSCGAPVEQAPTGRPRRFCSDACRKRAHRQATKRGRNGTVVS